MGGYRTSPEAQPNPIGGLAKTIPSGGRALSLSSSATPGIGEELFEYLDAPVRRVGATDTFVGYAPQLEDFILPQSEDVEAAVQDLMKY